MLRRFGFAVIMILGMIHEASGQNPGEKTVFHRVVKGDLRQVLVVRGELQPLKQTDIVCQLKSEDGTGRASTIVWLIEDGSMVKKGELIARLDDSRMKEFLQNQTLVCKHKQAAVEEAREEVELIKSRSELEVKSAELGIQLLNLELADAKDESVKARLSIRKQQAELVLRQAQLEKGFRIRKYENKLQPLELELQKAKGLLMEAENQLECCQIRAPQDGLLVYYIPESAHLAGEGIAEGASVKAGQKLFAIPDLSQFQIVCKVPESQVPQLQVGMSAIVTMPQGKTSATINHVATLASASDFLKTREKVYPVRLTLAASDFQARLKPGMTGQVMINAGERKNVVLAPLKAIWTAGGQRFCYLKTDNGINRHQIKLGLVNEQYAEVLSGLKAGDEIVFDAIARLEGSKPPSVKPDR